MFNSKAIKIYYIVTIHIYSFPMSSRFIIYPPSIFFHPMQICIPFLLQISRCPPMQNLLTLLLILLILMFCIIKLTNKFYCSGWGNSYKTLSDMVLVMREKATLNGLTRWILSKQFSVINNHSRIRVCVFKTL